MRRTQLILPQGKVYIVLLYLYMLQERPEISGVVCVVLCVCVCVLCVCVMNASYFKHLLPTQRPCQRMFKLPCNYVHLTH